jgi:hypothetical protein
MVVGIARIAPGPFLQLGPGASSLKKPGDSCLIPAPDKRPPHAAPVGTLLIDYCSERGFLKPERRSSRRDHD